ncbi:hypothetical protein GCM10017744_058100 [Streptomyces antimycoticus]|uniref:Uncharacterized protein n=1 Tax=Streptomyces antimycoticus TaxID=68175 RepID=A0A4D4K9I9_9ACTN|nr:hypothetical protein SANT12839_044120 [Streptomyces antimycoticus]
MRRAGGWSGCTRKARRSRRSVLRRVGADRKAAEGRPVAAEKKPLRPLKGPENADNPRVFPLTP